MANIGSVTAPMFMSATINVVDELKDGRPDQAFKAALANVSVFAGLVAIGQFVDWGLAAVLAMLNLLYTFLTDGADFIDWFSKLVNGLN